MSRPSVRSRLLAAFLGRTLRPYCEHAELRPLNVFLIRAMGEAFTPLRLPFGVRRHKVRQGDVRGVWVEPDGVSREAGVLLYLHGGGFFFGSPRAHDNLVRRLSAASGLSAFIVDYRRAPRHIFPAAADDCLAAYQWLLEQGVEPDRIALAGDSAGGQLCLSVLNDATRSRLPLPAAVLLMSPVVDGTVSSPLALDRARRDRLRRDPVISPAFGRRCAAAYAGGVDERDPRVDLLEAPKADWPKVLIQVGETECLQADAEALHASLTSRGVPCELQVWAGQVHVFQAWWGLLPEARRALTGAGAFLRAATAVPGRLPAVEETAS